MSLRGITAAEIAAQKGISVQAVRKKLGDNFTLCFSPVPNGRPEKIYKKSALELWGTMEQTEMETARKVRADKTVSRKVDAEQEKEFFERLKQMVFSSAQFNLRLATEKICEQFAAEGKQGFEVEYMYEKRVLRKDKHYVSPVHSENWRYKHRMAYHRDEMNKQLNAHRYSYLELGESLGWIGRGYGAAEAGWAIDCRSYDARTIAEDGRIVLGRAIFIRCAFTGMALWVKPIKGGNETAQEVIEAVLECAIYWQKTPQYFFAIDNGTGLNAERTLGVLRSLLPDSAFEQAAMRPEIFHDGDPILRNRPHTPTSMFKASLERFFKIVKDEYDAVHYAKSFVGGTRQEAVRLTISNVPVMRHSELVTTTFYNNQLWSWLGEAYTKRLRPVMFPGFHKRTGLAPTVANVAGFYWSAAKRLPAEEKCAQLLYWTAKKRGRRKCKLGRVEVQIDGANWVCAHAGLAKYIGQHVTVIPMPPALLDDARTAGGVKQLALLYYTGAIKGSAAGTEEAPVFIGVASNSYITSIGQLTAVREDVGAAMRGAREYYHTPKSELKAAVFPKEIQSPVIVQTQVLTEGAEDYSEDYSMGETDFLAGHFDPEL